MAIYGRTGAIVTIVRKGVLADVEKLDGRKPDKEDREAMKNDAYVVVKSFRFPSPDMSSRFIGPPPWVRRNIVPGAPPSAGTTGGGCMRGRRSAGLTLAGRRATAVLTPAARTCTTAAGPRARTASGLRGKRATRSRPW